MKKSIIYILLSCFGLSLCYSQTTTQNYVYSQTYKTATTSEYTGTNLTPANVTEEIQYIDGLGRPLQSVVKGVSPGGKDIIQPVEYDIYGRVVKEYEPYTLGSNNGAYSATATTQQAAFYANTFKVAPTQYPFSEKVYENSPSDRVLEQSAPGDAWKMGAGHTVKNQVLFNTTTDAIKQLSMDGSGNLVIGSNYAANMLSGVLLQDEHGNITKEFKDVLGNVVMKESGIIGTTAVRTYYVYDAFNNLRFVLPPQSFPSQSNYAGNTQAWLDDHAYQYKYDERQRMIYKKLPGAAAVYYVYDPMNKPILEQDGNLRAQSTATAQKWKYMKYDALDRVIQTGICTLNPTVTPTTNAHRVNAGISITSTYFSANYFNNFTNFYEERSCGNGYTDYTFPASGVCEVYTTNYYDDYDNTYCNTIITPSPGTPYLGWYQDINTKYTANKGTGYTELTSQVMNYRVRGLQTASKVKILDGSTTENTMMTNLYDTKNRPIQNIEERGSTNSFSKVVNTAYNFEGKPITVQSFYSNTPAAQTHRITERYDYDAGGRLVKQYLKPGTDAEKVVAQLGYNELGQLTEKSLHNTTGIAYLQNIDYRYNVRGWLKSINNAWLDNDSSYAALPANVTYANSKLSQLATINAAVVAGTQNPATALDAIRDDVKAKFLAGDGAGRYIMESFESLGNIDHASYSVLYPFFVGAFTNLANGTYLNNELTDLFGEEIEYETGNPELNAAAQFNGNISSIRWKSKRENVEKAYGFTYDNLNRLTDSKFAAFSAPAFGSILSTADFYNLYFKWNLQVDRYDENAITYDLNGNIKTLKRNGQTGGTAASPAFTPTAAPAIDNLTYWYSNGSNQLKAVNDALTNNVISLQFLDNGSAGSVAAPEYFYDANGNLTQDNNKGISSIAYNILNLPQLITFTSGNKIAFTYDANGQKLKKEIKNSSNVVTSVKYYLGGAEFIGTTSPTGLEAIYFSEGRLTKNGTNPYQFEYTIKDHLGNARVSFSDLNGNNTVDVSTEVLQDEGYYPFGLQQSPLGAVTGTQNKYQYNGKEFNDDLGLNELDYGARFYMPEIGRWNVIDGLAEKHPDYSIYTYVLNNPIMRFDPNGLTDFAFNEKSGLIKQVGEKNDAPDRLLKTNKNGEVKTKKNGKAKVAIDGIEQGILKDGQNFKNKDEVISVGGKNQPSVDGVKSFTLKLSEYLGKEIKGFSYSSNGSGNITDMIMGKYVSNSIHESFASPNALNKKYGNYSSNNIVQEFHTHPNGELGATQSAPDISTDVKYRDTDKSKMPNASFIILYRISGQEKPGEYDYTH